MFPEQVNRQVDARVCDSYKIYIVNMSPLMEPHLNPLDIYLDLNQILHAHKYQSP